MQRLISTKAQRRHFSYIGLALFACFIIMLILQLLIPALMMRLYPTYTTIPWLYFAINYLPYYLLAIPYAAILLRLNTYGTPPKNKLNFGQLLCYIPISIALTYIGNWIGTIINNTITVFSGKTPNNALEGLIGNTDFLTAFIFVVVLAPIVEELLFRKLLIDAMYPYGERVCIIMSALLFGAFHGNFYQFFYAALVGALLSFIYCRTGKIRYTILLHAIFNFIGSIISKFIISLVNADALANGDITVMLRDNPLGMLIFFIYSFVMLGLAALGVVMLIRKLRKTKLAEGAVKLQTPIVTVILNVGMILFLISCIILFIIGM